MVDYWAYAVVLYVLMTKKFPYEPQKNYKKMFAKKVEFDEEVINYYSKELVDFVKQLLAINPADRLGSKQGAKEIFNHPYLKNMKLKSD
jgi:serine/threonine protein kinase